MSSMAIAAVTATLRNILQTTLQQLPGGVSVTTLPLDKAEGLGEGNRVNLFLYQTSINAAWRNQAIPTKTRSGDPGIPPLGLNLHYLVTAYGDSQADEADHRLLGAAMLAFHDHPVLHRQDISDATTLSRILSTSGLEGQFEHVRVTHEALSLEELSKLWTTFQAKYRVSAAYEASVVLIESEHARPSPLPVLFRGPDDRGVDVQSQFPPELNGIEYRDLKAGLPAFPAAQLGDTLTLLGDRLPVRGAEIVVRDPSRRTLPGQVDNSVLARLAPRADSSAEQVFMTIDEAAAEWTSGLLSAAIEWQSAGKKRSTNQLRFALAPALRGAGPMSYSTPFEQQKRKLVLTCRPALPRDAEGQFPPVRLVLTPENAGAANPPPLNLDVASRHLTPTTPVFEIDTVPAGTYWVRLQMDAVESLMMVRDGSRIAMDDQLKVQL